MSENLPVTTFSKQPQVIAAANEVIDEVALVNWLGDATLNKTFGIYRLENYNPVEAETVLVYGASGSGKTFFCGTAGPRTLFLNIGDGLKTLKTIEFIKEVPDAGKMIIVDVTEKLNEQGVTTEAHAFDIVCKILDYFCANYVDQFDTVVLDDATFFRKFAMNAAINALADERKSELAKVERLKGLQQYIKPEVGEFGQEMAAIEWFLWTYTKRLKKLKKNFIMTAHERHIFGKPSKIGDEAPIEKIKPGFTGKSFPDFVPVFFDHVFWMEGITLANNQFVSRLYTKPYGGAICKTRHGNKLPAMIQQPNFQKMLNHVRKQ